MQHNFFRSIDWTLMKKREMPKTPYVPHVKDPTDTSHFDKTQTNMPVLSPPDPRSQLSSSDNQNIDNNSIEVLYEDN
jgi:hypothetical protein